MSPVPDLEADARILAKLRLHGEHESEVLASYQHLVDESSDEGIRYLGRLMIEDEERNRHVIIEMVNRIDSWMQGSSVEPATPELSPRVDRELLEATHELIELEHNDARELRALQRELRYVPPTSLLPLLLRLMLHDTERHIEILHFIRSYTG